MTAPALIRNARRQAELTQVELGRRLGLSQAAVAKLERSDANPTISTLARVLRATGHRLALEAAPWHPSIDVSLVRKHLELTPAQRLAGIEVMYEEGRALALAGERARGELA